MYVHGCADSSPKAENVAPAGNNLGLDSPQCRARTNYMYALFIHPEMREHSNISAQKANSNWRCESHTYFLLEAAGILPSASALSDAACLSLTTKQNPRMASGMRTAITMAEVTPACWALYMDWAAGVAGRKERGAE